jgi:hypothetical protein
VATMHVVLSGKVNAPPPLVGDEADVVAIEHGARAPYSGEPVDKMQEVVKFLWDTIVDLELSIYVIS